MPKRWRTASCTARRFQRAKGGEALRPIARGSKLGGFVIDLFLPKGYDPLTVTGSVLIAMYASYVALDLAKRVRSSDRALARGWLLGGSLAMGTGIWSMHFVGMQAFRLPIAVGYEYLMTGASWLAAVAASGVALTVASRDSVSLTRLGGSAVAMGGGICAMHYLGMLAMDMEPDIRWNWALVAASAGIAIGASAAALRIFVWLRDKADRVIAWQMLAAVVMGIAISGMHYTGMAAANFPQGTVCLSAGKLSGVGLSMLITLASMAMLTMILFTSILDARMQLRSAKLQQANKDLYDAAFRDPLTQLPNRALFADRLSSAVARGERDRARLALLFIDLDGFKPVNDSFGHAAGDSVLREVAARLRSVVRETDTVARTGGDEFLLLLEGYTDDSEAADVAQRVLTALSIPYALGERTAHLSCSIGIASFPDGGAREQLVSQADAAMYAAKRSGGGTYCFFQEHMDEHLIDQGELNRALQQALRNGEMKLYYQPKVDAATGRLTGAEALLRWHHPTRHTLMPPDFLPVAERFGMRGMVEDRVVEDVCRQLRAWLDQGFDTTVAVNISMHRLHQDDLGSRIEQALRRHGIDATRLTCEIAESEATRNPRVLEQLSRLGVQISIDEFGMGGTGPVQLRKVPAHQIKIHRNFIADLEHSAEARAIVDAIVRMAHALGVKVVAEGVETNRQRALLIEIGCDQLQGNLIAMPMQGHLLARWALGSDAQAPQVRGRARR